MENRHVQISGSAVLYYIVKSDSFRKQWNLKMKRKILSILLNSMVAHKEDITMMQNGCLIICLFRIPQDVLYDYERLVSLG